MECASCGEVIQGDHFENAIMVDESFSISVRRRGSYVHIDCVDNTERLVSWSFQKWATYQINRLRLGVGAQYNIHNDLVDALEELHPGTRSAYEQVVLRGTSGGGNVVETG